MAQRRLPRAAAKLKRQLRIESERAQRYRSAKQAALEAVPGPQRPTHELYAPIVALFGELRTRLESIPTSAQRQAVRR